MDLNNVSNNVKELRWFKKLNNFSMPKKYTLRMRTTNYACPFLQWHFRSVQQKKTLACCAPLMLLHCEGGLEEACELPGRLEWRLPALLQASGLVLQQVYSLGALWGVPVTVGDPTPDWCRKSLLCCPELTLCLEDKWLGGGG